VAEHRLVTLTGAGGIGKTRASLEIADALVVDGWTVAFVELSSLRRTNLLEDAVLRTLGVTYRGEEGMRSAASVLRLRQSLLILDDCEHVLAGADR
jgi:predicted ATPase